MRRPTVSLSALGQMVIRSNPSVAVAAWAFAAWAFGLAAFAVGCSSKPVTAVGDAGSGPQGTQNPGVGTTGQSEFVSAPPGANGSGTSGDTAQGGTFSASNAGTAGREP